MFKVLTIKETASLLRIQRAKVYILIQDGTLDAIKIGQAWRVRVESVERLIGPLDLTYLQDPANTNQRDSMNPEG
jgi:excisionase family DNA binding protein